jgi:predicted transcriptional regulator of viral defense system
MGSPPLPSGEAGRETGLFGPQLASVVDTSGAGRETGLFGPQLASVEADLAVAALAGAQHGVLCLEQLKALGVSASAARKRAAKGRLHRIHRGVYALAPIRLLDRHGLWLAAVLACGCGAVLSHRSAAVLHELRSQGSTRIEVTVPGGSSRRHAGVLVHRSSTLTAADATLVHGIPCTTVARTLLDIAGQLGRRALERACDQAEVLEVFDLKTITDQLERNPRHRGARTLRAVLEEHYIGQTLTWNEFEERFLALAREAGLPLPEVNVLLELNDGEPPIRVDFVWPARRLAVETDGRGSHLTHQAFERDRRRDQRLTMARWRPARFTRRQVKYSPAQVRATLGKLWSG